jgi:hypothetical protein
MHGVEQTLENRNGVHGDYHDQAATAEAIRAVMQKAKNWDTMSAIQRDALLMIAVKMSRILNGNPNYADHWHDLQGYARLAEREVIAHQPLPERVQVR